MSKQGKHEQWLAFVQRLSPDIDPGAVRLMDEMRVVAHALYQVGEGSLAATGLSFAKYRILMQLMFAEEMEGRRALNPSELSRRQGTSRNTISALIRDLEEEGLIARQLDRADRRKFLIALTPAGRARVREPASRHMRVVAGCFSVLDDAEQADLRRLLGKLRASLVQGDEAADTPDSAPSRVQGA